MYLFAILFLSIIAFLEVFNRDFIEKYKMIFVVLCFSFFIFHDGFRWETGTDWDAYTGFYSNYDVSAETTGFEIGYLSLTGITHFITDNYSFYLVVHAIIFYTLFFYTIFKISSSPFVSLLLFYMVTVPYLGMNRQFIAMAIWSIGLVFLLKGEKKYYLLFVLIACFFHRTALLALPMLFMNYKVKNWHIGLALVICLAISLSGIINTIGTGLALLMNTGDEAGKKMDIYTSMSNEFSLVSTLFSILKKSIWLGLLLIFEKVIDKDEKYNLLKNIYIFSICIYLLFNNTVLQIFVSRGLLYYNIIEIFIVPYVLTIFKPNYGKLALMFVLVAYCTINIFKGFSNYGDGTDYFEPYKGLFINTDYVRQNTD